MTVRKVQAIAVAALLSCAEAVPVLAAETGPPAHFKIIDRIGVEWAYGAFLQRYPTGPYADLARERIARLVASRPPVDLSRSLGMVYVARRDPPQIDVSGRVREPNYGDAHFVLRHIERQRRW
jgi:hypothetical protein